MIKFKFKLNDKTIESTVPENWHEVKLKHIIALDTKWSGDKTDMIGLLSAFTDQSYEDLEQAKGNLWEPLFQVLSFVFEAPKWDKIKLPDRVILGDKVVKPPKKVEMETFGQKVMAMQLIANESVEQIQKIPNILAIYLQPAYDAKFVSERVPDIEKKVLEMNCFDAMPYGMFFFRKLLKSNSFGRIGLRGSGRMLKNLLYIKRLALVN